jgi:hypothetical protein
VSALGSVDQGLSRVELSHDAVDGIALHSVDLDIATLGAETFSGTKDFNAAQETLRRAKSDSSARCEGALRARSLAPPEERLRSG